jgi:hypothetical protein
MPSRVGITLPLTDTWPTGAQKYVYHDSPLWELLQFPLLFPNWDPRNPPGWYPGMHSTADKPMSLQLYYRQRMLCEDRMNTLGRLGSEYLLDGFSRIEQQRLEAQRHTPALQRVARRGEINAAPADAQPGRVRISSWHRGSVKQQKILVEDAHALAGRKGKPTYFITMTSNPEWDEIKSNLLPGQCAMDRPALVASVFKLKRSKFLQDIRSGSWLPAGRGGIILSNGIVSVGFYGKRLCDNPS